MEPSFEHFIVTRFNRSVDGKIPGREWMDHRFDLFDRFCYPSIYGQSIHSFKWLVLCDPMTTKEDKTRLARYGAGFPGFVPVYSRDSVVEIIKARLEGQPTHIIQTRLDNDDALHEKFIELVQKEFRVQESPTFVNFTLGYMWDDTQRALYMRIHLSNMFLSLIQKREGFQSIYNVNHGHAAESGDVIQIATKPAWMIVCHTENRSNKPSGHAVGGPPKGFALKGEVWPPPKKVRVRKASADSVLIGTVHAGDRPDSWPYMTSIFHLQTPGEKWFKDHQGKQGVDEGHNDLIKYFLQETNCEWLFHLDSDAAVHPQTLTRLLSWKKKFVSALAFQRVRPFAPVYYRGEVEKGSFMRQIKETIDWLDEHSEEINSCGNSPVVLRDRPNDALRPVDRGGAHCLLVHREVFEAIKPPWFVRHGPNADEGRGSDFYFYMKAQEAGYDTYIDLSVIAGHQVGNLCIGALDFAVWSTQVSWNKLGRPVSKEKGERS